MREYKFRVWDGKEMHDNVVPWQWDFVISKSWHRCEKSTGDGILGSGGKTGEFLVPGIAFKELMQFTGLKDKNGKDIYEGDRVMELRDDFIQGSQVKFYYEIRWAKWCYVCYIADKWMKPLDTPFANGIEVIGNIYEKVFN